MKSTFPLIYLAGIALAGIALPATAADYRMSLIETGVRDYYCTFTTQLDNQSSEMLDDLNGYFVLSSGDDDVGESRSSSFLNTGSGSSTEVVFEAPNAPCGEIDSLRFVVTACRIGPSFLDQTDCAARLETVMPIREAVVR